MLMWAREGCLERDLNAATAARALAGKRWASRVEEEVVAAVVETTATVQVHVVAAVAEVEVDATSMVPVLVEAAAVHLARKSWAA